MYGASSLGLEDAVLWEAPALGPPPTPPVVADLEEIERCVREEGYANGYAEGLAQGQAEIRRLIAQFEGVIDAFVRPLSGLDAEVERALGALATEIAGALVRQTYTADPAQLAALVREAIASAGETTRPVEVRMHPDDIAMLKPLLTEVTRLVGDSTLSRGDVRVHAENVRIDGRLATRLKSVLDTLPMEEHP